MYNRVAQLLTASHLHGDVPELADGLDLGSSAERREGSSPSVPTRFTRLVIAKHSKEGTYFEDRNYPP